MDWAAVHFEWDEAKRRSNLGKHGIDFRDAARAMPLRPMLVYSSPRGNEERYVGVLEIGGKVIAVVYTRRGEAVRIISTRRARKGEERGYRSLFG